MSSLIAKVAIGLISRLITERFLAKLVIEALRAWAKTTSNVHDDRVVEAMAEALGIDPVALKEAAKDPTNVS